MSEMEDKGKEDEERQNIINDGLAEKLEIQTEKVNSIFENFATRNFLDETLEKFTRISQFRKVESQLDNFVTKHMNNKDMAHVDNLFRTLSNKLESEYFNKTTVVSKIGELDSKCKEEYIN